MADLREITPETPSGEAGSGRRRRGGGRAGNARRASSGLPAQAPWGQYAWSDAPVEPIDEEGVAAIDEAAMRILEEIGIDFLHDDALQRLKAAGCDVRAGSARVRMDRALVRHYAAMAPETFTITPRNPERQITLGGRHAAFVNVSSPPACRDLDRGRRPGDMASFRDLVKLSQHFNVIQVLGGYPVEPVDVHASVRHLHCLRDKLTLSDKVMHCYALGRERVEDAMEMVRLAGGLSHEAFAACPRVYTNINSTSPLKHDWPMLDGAMRLAERGQPTIITPFTLAGATSPITLAGSVAQATAEALACVVLLQIVRPGTPVGYGSFTNNADMRSGAPAFGTPEYVRATQISGQMARHYKLPFRASNACASKIPDTQAMWESMNSMWTCMTSHVNLVYHSAGWLEAGLCASYEKLVIDCEVLQQFAAMQRPVDTSAEALAVDAIAEVDAMPETSRHFFAPQHTRDRFETEFYQPFLSDWRDVGAWEEGGSQSAEQRANAVWKAVLNEFEAPPMDPGHREALDDFVERRIREGGAPTDF
ncbi:MAG: trimethylamine methyltransferase family protein [Pseudomonadota bacterium]